MKTIKTTISVFLCFCLMLTVIPFSALAEQVTVVSVTVDDLSVIEYSDGQQISAVEGNTVVPLYWSYPVDTTVTLTLSDGSTVVCTKDSGYYDIYKAAGTWPQFNDDQSADNPWGVGDHTVPWTLGEFSGTYTVTVEETPVYAIEVEDVTVRQYVDGSWNGHQDPNSGRWMSNTWFAYNTYNETGMVTVYYNDGPPMTLPASRLFSQTGYRMNYSLKQGYGNELTLGEHTAIARFMGVETTYTVTVVDAIDRLEWAKLPDKTSYLYSEAIDLSGGIVRVYFTDGTYEDVALDGDHRSFEFPVNALSGTYSAIVTPERFSDAGDATLSFRFLGETLTTNVVVKKAPSAVTLRADDDHSLALTLSYDNGLADDVLNIRTLRAYNGGSNSDGKRSLKGSLVTDQGVFNAEMHEDRNTGTLYVSLGIDHVDGIIATSNPVTDTAWFDALYTAQFSGSEYAIDTYHSDVDHFDGTVTHDNIDAVLRIAAFGLEGLATIPGDTTTEVIMSVNYAADIVNKHLDVADIDLTQSGYYDAQQHRICIPKAWDEYSSYRGMTDIIPVYRNGEWVVEIRRDNENSFMFTLNDDMLITSFDFYSVGDVNDDGNATTVDARMLIATVLTPTAPTSMLNNWQQLAADVDGNGTVNTTDARDLLKSVLA